LGRGCGCPLERRRISAFAGTIRAHRMIKSNRILHSEHYRMNIVTRSIKPSAVANIFVTRMLTRDLFAVVNRIVKFKSNM